MRNHSFQAKELFGLEIEYDRESILMFARAQLIIAGSDGLSPKELAACHDIGRGFGATEDMIDELRKFDFENSRLADYLPEPVRPWGKALLYFAIKVSYADGVYSDMERATIRAAAKICGIDEYTVRSIEGLVWAEIGLRETRIALLVGALADQPPR